LSVLLSRDPINDEIGIRRVDGLLYGDNVFEKRGIGWDAAGDGEKTRYFQGKGPLFNRETAGGSYFPCPGRTASVQCH